jgi:uncharacterized protein (TIGR02246 family)
MESDERAIRELHRSWIEAVNKRNLRGLLDSITEDVIFLGPGQAPASRDAFSSRFLEAHEQARIDCTSELQDVVVVGGVAYTLSRDTLTVMPRDGGDEMRFAGYRSTVYRKHADSQWLLARDTHTLSPVAKLGV